MYYADGKNNDSAILNSMYENNDGFRRFFDGPALLIVDGGFRDSVTVAERYGHDLAMLQLLTGKKKQFSDLKANESRPVTKIRWVIESVNGRIKNKFHFFNNTIQNHYVGNNKLLRFLRVACAMLNAYFPVIRAERPGDYQLAVFMKDRAELSNLLKERIETENWNTRRTVWKPLRASQITDFPMLSMDDLQDITVGIYQIKMAPAYISRHTARGRSSRTQM
jgi:hypothetical protein